MNPISSVEIHTGSRMHFGLICGTAQTGWVFGGVGLMVQQPGWRVRLCLCTTTNSSTSNHDRPEASQIIDRQSCLPNDVAPRVHKAWQSVINQLDWNQDAVQLQKDTRVHVLQAPPLHSGFGAGTQLTLGLTAAAQVLWSRGRSGSMLQLAHQLGRAGRSAVGTEGFERGGFIVDFGESSKPSDPRQLQRIAIPEDWRFVIVRPQRITGISGETEAAFFKRRQTMSSEEVRQLSGLIIDNLVPAVQQSDFEAFAISLERYGNTAGHFYAATQGDVFAHPQMNELAKWLTRQQIHGAAQSSWGPGICIPANSDSHAQTIVKNICGFLGELLADITITAPLNRGATVLSEAPVAGPNAIA